MWFYMGMARTLPPDCGGDNSSHQIVSRPTLNQYHETAESINGRMFGQENGAGFAIAEWQRGTNCLNVVLVLGTLLGGDLPFIWLSPPILLMWA